MKEQLKIKDILKISTCGSALILIFEILAVEVFPFVYSKIAKNVDYTHFLYSKNFKFVLSYICAYLIAIPLLILIFHFIRGKKINHSLKKFFKKPERSFAWCAKWTVIDIGVFQLVGFCLSYLITFVRSRFDLFPSDFMPEIKCNAFGYISLFVVTCILAPFFEELFFRGTLFINNKPMGEGFAIVVTGLFFALWHMNYPQFGIAFGSGMVASLMMLKTKSLLPSMLCHFTNNLFSYIIQIGNLQFYNTTKSYADTQNVLRFLYANNRAMFVLYAACMLIIVMFAVVGIVLLIRELLNLKKRSPLKKGSFEVSSVKAKILYFVSPVTLITVILLTYATFFTPGV